MRLVKSFKPTVVGSVGIGVRKSDAELLAKIDASLAKLKADGTLEKILPSGACCASADRGARERRQCANSSPTRSEFLPILLQGVQLTVLITLGSLVVSTRARLGLGGDAGLRHRRAARLSAR